MAPIVRTGLDVKLAQVKQRESGGNYSIPPEQNIDYPNSHASGAYQFQPGTWREWTQKSGIGTEYDEAYLAPPEVQDQVARYAAIYGPGVDSPALWGASSGQGAGPASSDPNIPPWMQKRLTEISKLSTERQTKLQPLIDEMLNNYREDRAQQKEAYQKMLTSIPGPAQPPQYQPKNPWEGWGGIAAAFVSLASAFTHQPAFVAMNGMAAALNAARQGDMDRYNMAYRVWKDNNDLAIQRSQLMQGAYRGAMELTKTDLSAGQAAIQMVAAKFDDPIMTQRALIGDFVGLSQVQAARQKAHESAAYWANKVELQNIELENAHEGEEAFRSKDPEQIQAWKDKTDVLARSGLLSGGYAAASRQDAQRDDVDLATQIVHRKHDKRDAEANHESPEIIQAIGDDIDRLEAEFAARHRKEPKEADEGSSKETRKAIHAQLAKDNPAWTKAKLGEETERIFKESQTELITDEAANIAADRVLAGDERATVGLARTGANIAKVTNAVATRGAARGMSGEDIAAKIAEFSGTMAAERTLGVRTATLGMAIAEMKTFAPMVIEASAKVSRTEFPTFNAVEQAIEKGTGSQDVVRLGIAVNALKNSYAVVVSRGTGVTTDDARKRSDEVIDKAWSSGQVVAAIDQLMKEANAAQTAPDTVRKELRAIITGKATPQTLPSIDLEGQAALGGEDAPAMIAGPAALPTITFDAAGQAAFAKLPSGAHYLTPMGNEMVK